MESANKPFTPSYDEQIAEIRIRVFKNAALVDVRLNTNYKPTSYEIIGAIESAKVNLINLQMAENKEHFKNIRKEPPEEGLSEEEFSKQWGDQPHKQ